MKLLQYLTIRITFALAMLGNLTSCTISITQAQSEGRSADQVDTSLDPDPSVSVPISAI